MKLVLPDKEGLTISLIKPDQIGAAVELFRVQLDEHRIETDSARILSVISRVVNDENLGFVLVAVEGGDLVGVAYCSAFLGLEHGGTSGWLEELYVLPGRRERGVGTRLVLEAIRIGAARGWLALDLEVEADHVRVVSLYERLGFRPHSRSRFCRKLTS